MLARALLPGGVGVTDGDQDEVMDWTDGLQLDVQLAVLSLSSLVTNLTLQLGHPTAQPAHFGQKSRYVLACMSDELMGESFGLGKSWIGPFVILVQENGPVLAIGIRTVR
jgi:hypothetical protein